MKTPPDGPAHIKKIRHTCSLVKLEQEKEIDGKVSFDLRQK
jgi:hypothetical protein